MIGMSEELVTLKRIEGEISLLVAMTKLLNKERLDAARQDLAKDKEMGEVLQTCQQPVTYGSLVSQVVSVTGSSERTVQSKVSQLKAWGVITASRQGHEVTYMSSGLLD